MAKDNVKIPAKHYVALQKRRDDGLPIGFMTPWGEDAAAKSRMQTVDNWAGRLSIEAMTIDNIPMSGFKLAKGIRTSGYGGYDHWRVEDPRGFELEISSGNLAQLLSVGMVENGEFIDECVWARSGANNVLLSTATEQYKHAIENTRVAGIKTSWKDVKTGNRVLLQNNTRGVWLGKMFTLSRGYNHNYSKSLGDNELEEGNKAYHVILVDVPSSSRIDQVLHLIASPKLSFIEDTKTTITKAEAEQRANELLEHNRCGVQWSRFRRPILISNEPIQCGKNLKITLSAIEINDHKDLVDLTNGYEHERVLVKSVDGRFGDINASHSKNNPMLTPISIPALHLSQFRKELIPNTDNNSYHWGRSNSPFIDNYEDYVFDDRDQFFNVILELTTNSGNIIHQKLR